MTSPLTRSPLFKSREIIAGSKSPPPLTTINSNNSIELNAIDLTNKICHQIELTKQQQLEFAEHTVNDLESTTITYTMSQLKSICHQCVPGWYRYSINRLEISQLHGGMTNALYVVWLINEHDDKITTAEEKQLLLDAHGLDSPRTYDRVVVRVFGNDTSIFFNRTLEQYVTKKLLITSQGPRVLSDFPNGRIERFISGRTLMCPHLHVPELCSYISTALARFHSESIDLSSVIDTDHVDTNDLSNTAFLTSPSNPLIFLNLRQWQQQASTITADQLNYALSDKTVADVQHEKLIRKQMYDYISVGSDEYVNEVNWLINKLQSLHSKIVFAHNDLQEGNIIVDDQYLDQIQIDKIVQYKPARDIESPLQPNQYPYKSIKTNQSYPIFGPTWIADTLPLTNNTPRTDIPKTDVSDSIRDASNNPVHLIDFEYSGWNYRAHDLANHFSEHYIDYSYSHWPYFIIVPKLLPSKSHMKSFILTYLQGYNSYNNISTPVSDSDVNELLIETLWFMLASNLMWVPWGVIQAKQSSLNFGFMEYGCARYQEYRRLKDIMTTDYNLIWAHHQS